MILPGSVPACPSSAHLPYLLIDLRYPTLVSQQRLSVIDRPPPLARSHRLVTGPSLESSWYMVTWMAWPGMAPFYLQIGGAIHLHDHRPQDPPTSLLEHLSRGLISSASLPSLRFTQADSSGHPALLVSAEVDGHFDPGGDHHLGVSGRARKPRDVEGRNQTVFLGVRQVGGFARFCAFLRSPQRFESVACGGSFKCWNIQWT